MRRLAVIVPLVALVSTSVACGGFLGFGDDDGDSPAPPSTGDAGADVLTAEGGSNPDEQCVTRRLVLGTDAGIGGSDWSPGINTVTGGAALLVMDGKLVSRSGDGAPGTRAEATLFSTQRDQLSRLHCDVRVSSTSFADDGRLFELRIEGPQWQGYYGVRIEWVDGKFQLAYQALPVDGKPEQALYQALVPPPQAGVFHDLVVDLDFRETPRLALSIAGAMLETPPPAPGRITRTQVVIGTAVNPPFEAHDVTYESVVCETCIRP